MKRPAHFTPLLLRRIRRAAGMGLSAERIAAQFHREPAFIKDICDLHGIRITGDARPERAVRVLACDQSTIGVTIASAHLTQLEREAARRGTSAQLLAGAILNLVAQDGLFGAVLDQ
jgi:hypothetical protein